VAPKLLTLDVEGQVSKRTYGILAGVIGSAVGAWLWSRQRRNQTTGPVRERGTIIFDNTPTAAPVSAEGII
jgi:hypothetical protein